MAYGFDHRTYAPIVVLWWEGDTSQDEVSRCLDELIAVIESWKEPGRILYDFTGVGSADASVRRQVASWRAEHHDLIVSKTQACGYVFGSKITRGYLTAIDWLRPHPGFSRGFFDRRDDGVRWLRQQDRLRAAGGL
jgi:hypothetical protein